jgi:predicted RNA-binding protein with PUA domain
VDGDGFPDFTDKPADPLSLWKLNPGEALRGDILGDAAVEGVIESELEETLWHIGILPHGARLLLSHKLP